MLAITRKEKIKELLAEKKSVTVTELAKMFNRTEETIRRDLTQLESEGFLKRIYGGAYIEDIVQSDVDVKLREKIMVKDKEIIASECAKRIMDGESIFLDASTTSLYIATKIKNKKLTVITNSLKIANLLSSAESIRLLMIGGILDNSSLSFVGKNAQTDMMQYFVDKAFISCRSIHLKSGITDSNEQQAEVRKLAIKHSNHAYLVVDHTKFDKTSFALIGQIEEINTVVVNRPLPPEWVEAFQANNVNIIQPES